jgi:hypothetical protein
MSKIQRRRLQQGQGQTMSEGEEEVRAEQPSETVSRTQSNDSDRPSSKSSDAGGDSSDRASTEGHRTLTKSKSAPTKRSKSLTNHSSRGIQDATNPKPASRKQNRPSKARSASAKAENETTASSPSQASGDAYGLGESDDSVQVIDYATIDSAAKSTTSPDAQDGNHTPIRSPPLRKYVSNARGRGNFRESPHFSPGYIRGRGNRRGGRQNRRPNNDGRNSPVIENESILADNAQDTELTSAKPDTAKVSDGQPVEEQGSNRSMERGPFHHRGGFRGRYRGGDPAFRRGRGSWRGHHRGAGGYQGTRPNYSPSSPSSGTSLKQEAEATGEHQGLAKEENTVEHLADAVSHTTLAPPTPHHAEEQAGDQLSGDAKDSEQQLQQQAKLDAIREAKREKNRKRRQAKRQTLKAAEQQQQQQQQSSPPADTLEPLQDQSSTTIPKTDTVKTPHHSDRSKRAQKSRPFGKGNKSNDEAVTATEPKPIDSNVLLPESVSQPEASPSTKVESVIDDKPRRQKMVKEPQQRHGDNWTTPIQNVDFKDRVAPTEDGGYEQHQETGEVAYDHQHHHKSNFKRNMPRQQEDNTRLIHARNDVPLPMGQPMQPTVSTPSFVSQPVAFAITSPNGGPIPVYTMPFPPMNSAMGDVQGGRQGMFYAPMMGSPAAPVTTTPNSATTVAPPNMMDGSMMYMPYDSPQMMMYNPYWYQPVGMTQQGMHQPTHGWNTSGGNVDYSNHWKPSSPERPPNDPNYHPSTLPGVAYPQHSEQMPYPNDNSGPQGVYYYPVSY